MPSLVKKRSKKAGLPPGTLVHIGEQKVEKTRITVISYDETQFQEQEAATIEEILPLRYTSNVTWINVDSIHQVEMVEGMGNHFGIHSLLLEDILNTEQRPKMEDFGEYIFIVLKMIYYDGTEDEIKVEQVSIIFGAYFVISFQERGGDVFDFIRERLRNNKARIRKLGADYLAYALVDAIVDHYFIIFEKMGERIEMIEEELVTTPKPETLREIHALKRELILLRKSIWPLRELVNGLARGESPLIHESTRIYLRDVYDHTIQVIDTIETFRDMVSGMLDIYLSSLSNRMNEVMKVLTIIATIFIPLTFIAGIYGMNFNYMPELEWHWGYQFVLVMMAVLGLLMLIYFRRKKWV
ncbi:MAG: magnesium/cobalt transporter CorA [Pseudomonadota bacterium]